MYRGNGYERKEKAPAPKGRGLHEKEDLFFSQATEIQIASVQNQKRGRIDGISFVMHANRGQDKPEQGISRQEVRRLIAEALRSFAGSLGDQAGGSHA